MGRSGAFRRRNQPPCGRSKGRHKLVRQRKRGARLIGTRSNQTDPEGPPPPAHRAASGPARLAGFHGVVVGNAGSAALLTTGRYEGAEATPRPAHWLYPLGYVTVRSRRGIQTPCTIIWGNGVAGFAPDRYRNGPLAGGLENTEGLKKTRNQGKARGAAKPVEQKAGRRALRASGRAPSLFVNPERVVGASSTNAKTFLPSCAVAARPSPEVIA